MRIVVALLLLAGCDKLFLQRNELRVDAAEFDGPPAPGCPSDFAGKRYLVIRNNLTWAAAELACRQYGHSFSHLAVVGDGVEATEISVVFGLTKDAWVGLTSLKRDPPVFHWITNEEAGIPWLASPQQPDGDGQCGRIAQNGAGVADTNCAEEDRHAVCECDNFPPDRTRF